MIKPSISRRYGFRTGMLESVPVVGLSLRCRGRRFKSGHPNIAETALYLRSAVCF